MDYRNNADLIGIFFSTPDAIRAYELTTNFQELGKTVFLGGLHATFRQEEALTYANSLILGECEGVINDLVDDFEKGKLKEIYKRDTLLDLNELKPFPKKLLSLEDYNECSTVVVSRGCTYKCHFCVVNPFFGKIRYRSIEHIVDEIKSSKASYFELHSDNLILDKVWAKELFKAIEPLGIYWSAASDISIAEDEELLDLAVKSGLNYVLIGLETPSQEALKKSGKGFVKVDEIKRRVEKLHEYGVIVDSAMMFGFDEHDNTIFDRSLEFALDVGIDICEPVIQIPFPGTKLFNDLEKENRILTYDWSLYDGTNVVYQPKTLSEDEIYMGIEKFYNEFNSKKNTKIRRAKQKNYLGENYYYI